MTKKFTRSNQASKKKRRRRKQPEDTALIASDTAPAASLVNQQTAFHEIIIAGRVPYSSQQEERYRALMAQSPQFFWTINAEGEIAEDVPAWRAYTGQTYEETLGHGWMRAIHKEDRLKTSEIWERARDAQSYYQVYFRLRRYDGVYRLFDTHGFPIFEKDGTLKGWVGVTVDITEQKALEDELKQSEERFRIANERLEEFLWLASHELKTPLTTTQINIQVAGRLLKNMPGGEIAASGELASKLDTLKEMVACADQQIHMLSRLVHDIVDASRIQANKLELHMRPRLCDLATITQDVIRSQRYVVPERDVLLSIRYAHMQNKTDPPVPIGETEMLIPIYADPDRIAQVITNYLTNALKYSPQRQPVDVRIQVDEEQATLTVQDYGSGLTTEEQEHVWERFYQVEGAERSSNQGAGLGLGLYISRSIIAWHQGTVGVQSAPGEGAAFWFTLPLAWPSTSSRQERINTIPDAI